MSCILARIAITALIFTVHAGASETTLRFKRLTTRHGLSSPFVTGITQDRLGFLWFATTDGLNRYDGYQFTAFRNKPSDSNSISDNAIRAICPSRAGDLWVATAKGLNRYDHAQEKFVRYRHNARSQGGLISDDVSSVYEDRDGFVWIGTDKGLSRLDLNAKTPQIFINYGIPHKETSTETSRNDIHSILKDSRGDLWVGTNRGLFRVSWENSLARFTYYEQGFSHAEYTAAALCEDNDGNLWVGIADGRLSRVNRATNTLKESVRGIEQSNLYDIFHDRKGHIWLGRVAGALRVNPKTGAVAQFGFDPDDPESLPGNEARAIFEDNTGNLWIGSSGIGLVTAASNSFTTYQHRTNDSHSLSYNEIGAIMTDSLGGLWIGTRRRGLNYKKPRNADFVVYNELPGGPRPASVQAILQQRGGDVWFGRTSGGISRYRPGTGEFIHLKFEGVKSLNGPSNNNVRSILEDSSGFLWFATAGGLDRYDPLRNEFIHFRHDPSDTNSISGNSLVSLCVDSKGNLWIGSWRRGLNRLDKSRARFTRYSHRKGDPPGLSTEIINSIAEDIHGNIWIAVMFEGLLKYDYAKDRFTQYTTDDGLPSNVVNKILPDQKGALWLGTRNGLSRFDPLTGQIKTFGIGAGLPGLEFTRSGCIAGDGRMYFGTFDGVIEFHPDSIQTNTFIPPVVITSFKVLGSPVNFSPESPAVHTTVFPYDRNSVSFEFVALDFTAPEMNQYAYKLDGVDETWVNSGTRRNVSYSHIEPGDYSFRVRGSNSDGLWNEAGVAVNFTITPPFWKMWWFRGLMAVLLGLLAYTVHRYRIAEVLRIERMRTRIAADLHDDISSSIASVALYSDVIQRQIQSESPEVGSLLRRIAEISREVQENISTIVWAVDPRRDELSEVLGYFQRYGQQLSKVAGVSFESRLPEKPEPINLSPDVRRAMFLIYKEALNNIFKHAHCSSVTLTCALVGNAFEMKLQDNGKGFDLTAVRRVNGLDNMKMRAKSIGAELKVDSEPGKGTTLVLRQRTA